MFTSNDRETIFIYYTISKRLVIDQIMDTIIYLNGLCFYFYLMVWEVLTCTLQLIWLDKVKLSLFLGKKIPTIAPQ